MFWKRCVLVFAFVVGFCVLSPNAAAQSNNNCLAITTWWFPLSIPTGSAYSSYPGNLYLSNLGMDRYVSTPTPCRCSGAAGAPPSNTARSPISLATGNTYVQEKDIRISGLGGGLNLVRTWNRLLFVSLR